MLLQYAGDELLRIEISVVPEMLLSDACTILTAAAACPVRLTLLRRRHSPQTDDEHQLSTVVDLEHERSGGETSSRLKYIVVGGTEPEYLQEPSSAGQPSPWRSEDPAGGRRPETTVDEVFDGRRVRRSESLDDLPPILVESAPGVHNTYIDLPAVVPPIQSSPSDEWNDESLSPPAAFLKTQSSPTLDKTMELPPTFPATSSTQRLGQSVDDLHTHVRRGGRSDVQENEDLERTATVDVETIDSMYSKEDQLDEPAVNGALHREGPDEECADHHGYYIVTDNADPLMNNGKTDTVQPTPLFAEHDKGVPTSAAEPARVNHSTGPRLRKAVDDADLSGVERALRAPERSSAGGMAYYVNLEDHHFSGFPGPRVDGKSHSAHDLRTS